MRYFSDGLVLSSQAFVEKFFAANRSMFGKRRTTGASPMRHLDLPELFVARDLRREVLSGQRPRPIRDPNLR